MRKLFFGLIYLGLSVFAIVYATTSMISSSPGKARVVEYIENQANAVQESSTLKVLSLNVAHGRNTSFNQIMLKKREIKNNLLKIANLIKQEKPALVALQEADGRSFWSQNFNHVKYIAFYSGFGYSVHGTHVNGAGIRFGTAVLSQIKPVDSYAYTFNPSPPTFAKGFTIVKIKWPGTQGREVAFISLHLDYSRESVQTEQLAELIKYLKKNRKPFIIAGDFNMNLAKSPVKFSKLKNELGVKAWQLDNRSLVTFPSKKSRIDWILVSPEMEIRSHKILKQKVADHFPIVVEVALKTN